MPGDGHQHSSSFVGARLAVTYWLRPRLVAPTHTTAALSSASNLGFQANAPGQPVTFVAGPPNIANTNGASVRTDAASSGRRACRASDSCRRSNRAQHPTARLGLRGRRSRNRAHTDAAGLKKGGVLRIGSEVDVDSVDPAIADGTPHSWMVEYATCAKLFNYPDASGAAGARSLQRWRPLRDGAQPEDVHLPAQEDLPLQHRCTGHRG